ncbi:putative ribonuclease H-like domain-containing protein [Tanacetum coccineum]
MDWSPQFNDFLVRVSCDDDVGDVNIVEPMLVKVIFKETTESVIKKEDMAKRKMMNSCVYIWQIYLGFTGFEDPEFPNRVYKVEKALYGVLQTKHLELGIEILSTYLLDNGFQRGQIDKTLFIKMVKSDILLVQVYVDDIIFGSTKKELCTEFEKLMHKKFQISSMGELTFFLGLQVTQKDDGIFISQDKYLDEILKKFGFSTMKTASTPMETSKPLIKDENAKDDRSMIGSLMYLTSSRPDIMFIVCACARFQVTPKVSHLHAMKRIFRYLKGQPKLGLWYPKDSPFDLEAYTDSDYAGASLDRKFTIGGCQFLRSRLISWQCKKQTVVANSNTEAEYVAAASCCGQPLWIQNQMLDYGYNFMNTKIFIDNESTICIVKNPVFHLKTKHIEIRHHFIRDSNKKKLIQMIKIHTYQNVADLLIKAFDVGTFQYLIAKPITDEAANEGMYLYIPMIHYSMEVEVKKVVSTAKVITVSATTTTFNELTLAQTLIKIKTAKPKAVTTTATTTTTVVTRLKARGVVKEKGKAKMIEPEKPLKKKDQILIDEEIAQKLQAQLNAELEEEEKLAKQREEDANITEWHNVQAMIDADYELAARLQAQEQEAFQKAFDKTMGWIDSFVSMDFEVVKGGKEKDKGSVTRAEENSSKRAGIELEQERIKKQKIDDGQEEAKMKKHIEIVIDEEEIAFDVIPLATKPPIIVGCKEISIRKDWILSNHKS